MMIDWFLQTCRPKPAARHLSLSLSMMMMMMMTMMSLLLQLSKILSAHCFATVCMKGTNPSGASAKI